MVKRIFTMLIVMCLVVMCLTGCNDQAIEQMKTGMEANTDIQLSVAEQVSTVANEELTWEHLDKLTTYEDLRKTWDDKLNIIKFDKGSKNGVIFIDTKGNWTGNSVLMYAFQNKEFVTNYWSDTKLRNELANKAVEKFSDIKNTTTGIYASINAYYNILPANTDGTSGLFDILSRKEVMTAIYRVDTPVKELNNTNKFTEKFGENVYNAYACEMETFSYLQSDNNSLNKYTYNAPMTKAEAVYMLVQRYYKPEYDALVLDDSAIFEDCKNAGDILTKYELPKGYSWQTYVLEHCLQNKNSGLSEDLYKALVIAYKHGMISKKTEWYQGINFGELLTMIINTYRSMYTDSTFPVNAKTGFNEGSGIPDDNDGETTLDGIDINNSDTSGTSETSESNTSGESGVISEDNTSSTSETSENNTSSESNTSGESETSVTSE